MIQVASRVGLPEKQPTVWHALEIAAIVASLETDQDLGLTSSQVKQRLAQYGANELTAKKSKPWWLKFLLQFNQPLLIILLCAGLVKALSGSLVNAGVIWGVTTTNAIIGFVQESKAEGAFAKRA